MKFFKVWAMTFFATSSGGVEGEVIVNPSGIAYIRGSNIYMLNGDCHDCGGKDIEKLLKGCSVEIVNGQDSYVEDFDFNEKV